MRYPTGKDSDPAETRDWLDSLEAVRHQGGAERVNYLLARMHEWAGQNGVTIPFSANTPYFNTIPPQAQPAYPGDRHIERRIKSLVRWNAMAMVVRANRAASGIGGHISSFASSATLYEIGFNHFLHARTDEHPGDLIYIQGHVTPGIYSRAYVERRLDERHLINFRRELAEGGGLSSYPHPWLMPNFWQFPTVSMGLGPINSIYQARFNRYLRDRKLADTDASRVWAFLGDGEMDEPESLGAITLASREKLDNLTWVINCNLQRLDGPVRGNGSIVRELEAAFRGAGWNVIKVLWSSEWDPLFERDRQGLMAQAMDDTVDGQYQRYEIEPGAYAREHFFGRSPELARLVEDMSDEEIEHLRLGGHDPEKVYAAFASAVAHRGQPTVILARTIKGYGLGEAGEGRNITHQQKKLNEDELRHFRDRFDVPITDEQLAEAPFCRFDEDSPEYQYLMERRSALGGCMPRRKVTVAPLAAPPTNIFDEFYAGSEGRAAATTMAFVRMLGRLLRDKNLGKLIVPIVPDEARTFGMEALFRSIGIYASTGQLYDPVDSHLLLKYEERKNGQILEEGITEAGSMASFTAAATAYATHGINTIPFYVYYSMFGFQRVGDSIWAAADSRSRGFLVGGTAGRTTLAGEGLQHQDGHSILHASTVPNLITYDAAWAYELAVIIRDGIRRMYEEQESVFYYLTVYNETYPMPPMPKGVEDGILRGIYKFSAAQRPGKMPRVHLFGSGPLLRVALEAQQKLRDAFKVAADVWSVTSYNELYRDALACERWNRLHPDETPRQPFITQQLGDARWPVVVTSDYVKAIPHRLSPWIDGGLCVLGTDGFGRSETREELRRFFETDAGHVTYAALHQLALQGKFDVRKLKDARDSLGIDAERENPAVS
ncbi:MAG: pyruvate dehydrogenase (acetyl-transferring), homodimeric type [Phycisphaerae bacterium]|nr:pyruvate dehydrogenase (acetyl-transferring), homodimeric type [Phycisphaerae bacterium]